MTNLLMDELFERAGDELWQQRERFLWAETKRAAEIAGVLWKDEEELKTFAKERLVIVEVTAAEKTYLYLIPEGYDHNSENIMNDGICICHVPTVLAADIQHDENTMQHKVTLTLK